MNQKQTRDGGRKGGGGGGRRTQTSNFPGAKHSGKCTAYVRPPITSDPVIPIAHRRETGREGWREEAGEGGRVGEDEVQSR